MRGASALERGAALQALPPLREVIARHGLSARKSLGQNFLFDLNLTRRIARAGGPLAGCHVVEVGPGPGGLTRALLLEGAAHVTAIERDPRALPALRRRSPQPRPGRLTIVEGDALEFDFSALAGERPLRIVANLPYNVGTPLLVGWLSAEPWPPYWQSLTLMFQREVAERIVAAARTKAYGRLAVLAQWRAAAKSSSTSRRAPSRRRRRSIQQSCGSSHAPTPSRFRSRPSKRSPPRPSGSGARCCALA